MKKFIFSILFLLLCASVSQATERIVSSNATFNTALSSTVAGDIITLQNGTYSPISIDCNAGGPQGKSGAPITIRAQNERQAFLDYTGGDYGPANFQLSNCNWYIIQGLRFRHNVTAGSFFGLLTFFNVNDSIARRNLFTDCTHQFSAGHGWANLENYHCFGMGGNSNGNLIEENEAYDFERYAFFVGIDGRTYPTLRTTFFRRNYCNQRSYESVAGGYCMVAYPGHNATFENNISENAGGGTSNSKYTDHNHDVKYLGNILFGYYGQLADMCAQSTINRPKDNTFINNVLSTDWIHPMTNSGGQNSIWNNNTVYTRSTSGEGFSLDYFGDAGPETPGAPPNCTDYANTATFTTTGQNNLLVAATSNPIGFSMNTSPFPQGTWSFQRSNAIGFSTPYSPSAANANWNGYAHTDTVPTAQRNCPAFILTVAQGGTASLKGAGVSGADIGANIVYAYENGVLNTSKPLWNPVTKELNNQFIGAPVTGVNDSSVQSLRNFGSRFHPNCPQSAFPTVTAPVVLTITTNGGNGAGSDFSTNSTTLSLTGTLQ